jgi:hypothetical protein
LHLESNFVGYLHRAPHVVPVVREIVLREGVQNAGEAAFGKILHVCNDVLEDAIAEIRCPYADRVRSLSWIFPLIPPSASYPHTEGNM